MYVEYNGNSNTQRPFTGEIVEHYDEKDGGLKKSKSLYKDGKLDGQNNLWYKSGKKWFQKNYKDGELILQRCFDVDGNECECSDLGRGCK